MAKEEREAMLVKFIPNNEELQKIIEEFAEKGYERGITNFKAPNIAIINETEEDDKMKIDIHEAPREEIHKFTRFFEDIWK